MALWGCPRVINLLRVVKFCRGKLGRDVQCCPHPHVVFQESTEILCLLFLESASQSVLSNTQHQYYLRVVPLNYCYLLFSRLLRSGEETTIMVGFSLRLLQETPSNYWLLSREEPRVFSSLFRNSLKIRKKMSYGKRTKTLDLVKRPVGVINGILLGYVSWLFADSHFDVISLYF